MSDEAIVPTRKHEEAKLGLSLLTAVIGTIGGFWLGSSWWAMLPWGVMSIATWHAHRSAREQGRDIIAGRITLASRIVCAMWALTLGYTYLP